MKGVLGSFKGVKLFLLSLNGPKGRKNIIMAEAKKITMDDALTKTSRPEEFKRLVGLFQ